MKKQFKAEPNTGIIHFLSDARGIYIPRDWMQSIDPDYWLPVSDEDKLILSDPDHEYYWDTWHDIEQSQYTMDTNGNRWTLYQDGDLWLICPELMTLEECENFGFEYEN